MTTETLFDASGSVSKIKSALAEVTDPEIPVLSIHEMGILRDVSFENGVVNITITPTYSGCPALDQITSDIKETLTKSGYLKHQVQIVLSPAWTTDWMDEDAKKKLREYGIAPPCKTIDLDSRTGEHRLQFTPRCPQCNSLNTVQQSEFGSTACKSLWKCKACLEPFDYFKPI